MLTPLSESKYNKSNNSKNTNNNNSKSSNLGLVSQHRRCNDSSSNIRVAIIRESNSEF